MIEVINPLVALANHIAWPVTALILGLWLIKELKGGLLLQVLKGIGRVKMGGFEFERDVNEVTSLATAAKLPKAPEPANVPDDGLEADQTTAYEKVMEAWTTLATILTALAVRHGGQDDQRRVRENLGLLADRQVIDAKLFELIRSLQKARNSMRKIGEAAVDAVSASDYTATARSVVSVLKQKLA